MDRFIIFVAGIAGWIECRADDRRAAYAYACDCLGLRQLPRRHCIVRVAS